MLALDLSEAEATAKFKAEIKNSNFQILTVATKTDAAPKENLKHFDDELLKLKGDLSVKALENQPQKLEGQFSVFVCQI